MWPEEPADHCENRSHVACHSCRRRKVKCDRDLPSCRVCQQSDQHCAYPDRTGKPGPKIGTTQRRGRKSREQCHTQSSNTQKSTQETPPWAVDEAVTEPDTVSERRDDPGPPPSISWRQSTSSARPPRRESIASAISGDEHRGSRDWDPQLNMHDLSFILHPSHEASTPGTEHPPAATTPPLPVTPDAHRLYTEICRSIGLQEQTMEKLIQIYFDNMVAINVFHEPSFRDSLGTISSQLQLTALLAAIAGYAVRFVQFQVDDKLQREIDSLPLREGAPSHFISLASQSIRSALDECGDEPPPLCLVQALILTAHCQLARGVRGNSWRSLGTCVRLAYELNLHLLDSRRPVEPVEEDPQSWVLAEERRRAWWAIWEMDVFASTIRRTPTAINWAQMEVLLPSPDSHWHGNSPTKSCYFQLDPGQRWRALQESGNKSGKAWFIVINSFMKDAQSISCPRGVPFANSPSLDRKGTSLDGVRALFTQHHLEDVEEARQKLETLANSVYCLVRVIPEHLQYRNQYLEFPPRVPGRVEPDRQLHCSIYNIYVMTQLTRLMIHRYDVFRGQVKLHHPAHCGTSSGSGKRCFAAFEDQEPPATRQYFEAADNILRIVNRSNENHIRHINPFLSSTIWLAAAVQLFRKQFRGPATQNTLIKTRFDVLYLTYKECVCFWGTQTAMQENLESIEARLEGHGNKPQRLLAFVKGMPAVSDASAHGPWSSNASDPQTGKPVNATETRTFPGTTATASSVQQVGHVPPQKEPRLSLPQSPPSSEIGSSQRPGDTSQRQRQQSNNLVCLSQQPTFDPNPSNMGNDVFMMQCEDFQGQVDPGMSTLSSLPLFDAWEDFSLPDDVRDMLSGYSTY